MIPVSKQTAMMPLGAIRKLPIAFQPTFYSKVADLAQGVNEQMLSDSAAMFMDQVAELNKIVASGRSTDSKVVEDALLRVQRFWTSTHYLLKGYTRSTNPQEATMAKKALDLFKRIQGRMLRTNAYEMLMTLINNIDNAWTPTELSGTFLETWKAQLVSVANDYLQVYQNRVDKGATHICFTEKKLDVFETFRFFYLNLHVAIGLTGDLSLSQLQADINELIMIYTTISKSRATRKANQRVEEEHDNIEEEPSSVDDSVEEQVETPATATIGDAEETDTSERA